MLQVAKIINILIRIVFSQNKTVKENAKPNETKHYVSLMLEQLSKSLTDGIKQCYTLLTLHCS